MYVCDDPNKAAAATLPDYQAAVGAIKSKSDAASFFKKHGFTLD